MTEKKNIGPKKRTDSTARVCPSCGQPKRLGADYCKRCAKQEPPQGKRRPTRRTRASNRTNEHRIGTGCVGPGRKRFTKACNTQGWLTSEEDPKQERCPVCATEFALLPITPQRKRGRAKRARPEAVTDDTEWQRNYQQSLQTLQTQRDLEAKGLKYITVKEVQDGKTVYITKVDMRRKRVSRTK